MAGPFNCVYRIDCQQVAPTEPGVWTFQPTLVGGGSDQQPVFARLLAPATRASPSYGAATRRLSFLPRLAIIRTLLRALAIRMLRAAQRSAIITREFLHNV